MTVTISHLLMGRHNYIVVISVIAALLLAFINAVVDDGKWLIPIVLVLGLILLTVSIHALSYGLNVRRWPKVKIKYISQSIQTKKKVYTAGVLLTDYYPSVEYEYAYDNEVYRNNSISWVDDDLFYSNIKNAERKLSELALLDCAYVNPNHPNESYIHSRISLHYMIRFCVLLVFAVAMIYMSLT